MNFKGMWMYFITELIVLMLQAEKQRQLDQANVIPISFGAWNG